jgi:hypothetical protein
MLPQVARHYQFQRVALSNLEPYPVIATTGQTPYRSASVRQVVRGFCDRIH